MASLKICHNESKYTFHWGIPYYDMIDVVAFDVPVDVQKKKAKWRSRIHVADLSLVGIRLSMYSLQLFDESRIWIEKRPV